MTLRGCFSLWSILYSDMLSLFHKRWSFTQSFLQRVGFRIWDEGFGILLYYIIRSNRNWGHLRFFLNHPGRLPSSLWLGFLPVCISSLCAAWCSMCSEPSVGKCNSSPRCLKPGGCATRLDDLNKINAGRKKH